MQVSQCAIFSSDTSRRIFCWFLLLSDLRSSLRKPIAMWTIGVKNQIRGPSDTGPMTGLTSKCQNVKMSLRIWSRIWPFLQHSYVSLSSFSAGGDDISFQISGDQPGFGISAGQRFYFQNFLSELDAPGEYYIDRDNKKIYFWPTSSDFTDSDVIVSTTDHIFKLNCVSYVTFEGFTLEATRKAVSFLTLSKYGIAD